MKAKRLEAKHNGDKTTANALKLPLNTYYGALGAKGNPLRDDKNRLAVCISGQVALSILINKLRKIPSLKMVSTNTDAVQFEIDENYVPLAEQILNDWQKRYRLELERDDVIKLVMRDINNYIELLETKKGKEVNFKGACFSSCPKIIIDENNKIITKYEPKFKANSLAIVSEALAKYLLFDIPIEYTINKDNDIRKYQLISHLGSTYEKCVQETKDGYVDLENRNNRLYAGKKTAGLIYKRKPNGRLDKLANCPTNPIVDNANKCTIDDINKEWYIKLATQWANDFKGVKRLTEYKKTELIEMAKELGIEFEPKIKKDELIKLIENVKGNEEKIMANQKLNIYQKINEIKKEIKGMEFILDCVQATNLGGKEYPSIGQYYRAINDLSIKYNLLFMWEVVEVESIEKDMFKPVNKMPQHVTTVRCRASFIDADSYKNDSERAYDEVYYNVVASGSDTCDKGASAASSMAFRNWFEKNFTPSHLTIEEFGGETEISDNAEHTAEPKIPTYIPPEKKEELTQEVVAEVQKTESDKDDAKEVIDKIMKVRELTTNPDWGASTLDQLVKGELSSADILEISLKVDNKLDSLKEE